MHNFNTAQSGQHGTVWHTRLDDPHHGSLLDPPMLQASKVHPFSPSSSGAEIILQRGLLGRSENDPETVPSSPKPTMEPGRSKIHRSPSGIIPNDATGKGLPGTSTARGFGTSPKIHNELSHRFESPQLILQESIPMLTILSSIFPHYFGIYIYISICPMGGRCASPRIPDTSQKTLYSNSVYVYTISHY